MQGPRAHEPGSRATAAARPKAIRRAALTIILIATSANRPPILPFLLTGDVFLAMRIGTGWQPDWQLQTGSRVARVVGLVMVAITIVRGG